MNISEKLKTSLSFEQKQALSFCTKLADSLDIKIYLIGGVVRDVILDRKFNDIDIIMEYDGIIFAELLEQKYKNEVKILAKNDKFKTAKLQFRINKKTFEVDIASTRSEVYEYPSALPILAETAVSLKKDIARRDFTINSLAMSLNSFNFGEILDETGSGLEDLKNRQIRILHADSFMDDPSRIVRGLKYRTKLNFELENDTFILEQECLNSNKYSDDCQERIKKEVKETLNLLSSYSFDCFLSENIYKLIISNISKKNIPSGNLICDVIENNLKHIEQDNIWLIFLCIIFSFAPEDSVLKNVKKLALTKIEQNIVNDFFDMKKDIKSLINTQKQFDTYNFLEKYSSEAIIANLCIDKSAEINEKVYLYFNKLKSMKLSVSGKDIENSGIEPGKVYGTILSKTLEEKMNNNLDENQEYDVFKNILEFYK